MSTLQNPIAAAAAAVAAVIGIAVVLVKEIVLPTHTAAITFEAAVAKKELADKLDNTRREHSASQTALAKERETTEALKAEVDNLKSRIKDLNYALLATQQTNLFSKNSPYPFGLDKVKVGDNLALVEEAYPGPKLRREKRSTVVQDGHDLFSEIYYDFIPETENKIVDGIRFYISNYKRSKNSLAPVPDGWLREALVRAMGDGVLVGPDDDCLAWMLPERVSENRILVYHGKGDFSFSILTTRSVPVHCQINAKQVEAIKKANQK